jgi:hypothetical protein
MGALRDGLGNAISFSGTVRARTVRTMLVLVTAVMIATLAVRVSNGG